MAEPSDSEALAEALATDVQRVRRLRSPHVRMIIWFLVSLGLTVPLVGMIGLRSDIEARLAEPRFLLEVLAALTVSMLAAAAAFCAGCPGRPLWERFAPVPALAVWLGSLGTGCWENWISHGRDGLVISPDLVCFPYIVLLGSLPALLILAMIRRGAPIAPVSATMLATLAAAALGAAALRLVHPQDASVMVLVWQFGSVALLTGLGAMMGRLVLRWPHAT